MAFEIERKFLITEGEWRNEAPTQIVQAYLNRDPARCVRVRVNGPDAFITVKGLAKDEAGLETPEFEYPIPLSDAMSLLGFCGPEQIQKLRRRVKIGAHIWDVDEFQGLNQGLLIAEVELQSVKEEFEKPGWLLDEVTGDGRYFNSNLIQNPYSTW